MKKLSNKPALLALAAAVALPPVAVSAQDAAETAAQATEQTDLIVTGEVPADLSQFPAGPDIDGFISARRGEKMQVTAPGGDKSVVMISQGTEVRSSGGFLGLGKTKLTNAQLLNGLPVTVKTVQWNGALVASQVKLKSSDLKTASMIARGTEQGFADQTAATEALRGRMADIDKYNVKGVTNVNFDTGKWNLTEEAKANLCAAANQANTTENALLLVVGYTDNVGDEDYNQELSEKRASRVTNYLQQYCGWKPYRMLTPTGMAEADPAADNSTEAGKAQNRRVAVNILVSKSVDGL